MGKTKHVGRWSGIAFLGLALAGCAQPLQTRSNSDPFLGDRGTRIPPQQLGGLPPAPQPSTLSPTTVGLTTGRPSENYLAIDHRSNTAMQPVGQGQWQGNNGVVVPVPVRSGPSHSLTIEQAREMLRARGVTWQQLEMSGGMWHFRCSIPNPQNLAVSRFYEAHAADELSAVRAVLERIDGQR